MAVTISPAHVLISEQTLSAAAASVTFSSIPQTYKDLVLEVVPSGQSGVDGNSAAITFNGSATGYSWTQVVGDGSAASSGRATSQTALGMFNLNASNPSTGIAHIMSYGNTNVYKTVLVRSDASMKYVIARVGLWQSTSAITSIKVQMESSLVFNANSTFRLWGVA